MPHFSILDFGHNGIMPFCLKTSHLEPCMGTVYFQYHKCVEMPVGEMSVDKMSVGEMSVDKMSVGEMSVDKITVDKMSVTRCL